MKNILIIFFLFLGYNLVAQTRPTGVPTQFSTGWFRWGFAQSDSGLIIGRRDTTFLPRFTGTVVMRPQNRKFYYYDSTDLRWYNFGTSIDTTSLSNRINLKLNISDTASMLSPYLPKIDTTAKWVTGIYRKTASDSVFYIKGGQSVFAFRDSIGAGGSGLTSVGLSMPSAFTVTNSPLTVNGTIAVSGAGTSSDYMKGNGTIGVTDTSMIPNFSVKVRSLFSGSSPITFNQSSGVIGINNANTSGQKGAATFNNTDFTDNGSGLISLRNPSGNAGVDTIFRTPGVDSIYYTINSTQYAIKDSAGSGGGGTVTNVSGTSNRITVTNPTTTPVIDIAATYVGQTSLTTLGTIATGTWNATAIGAIYGGTGQTTVTTGDLLYGSASNTWSKLADVATGNALISGGVTTAPSWGKIGLATHVSGILPIANGGTGTATPSLVAGTNVSITGSWPNQTINATGGGGGSVKAGIQTTLTGTDTLNYDPRINSNLIFNDFLLTTIGPKWNTSNAPNTTITFASGHMRLVGGSSTDYIFDSTTTIIHRWTEEIGAVIQSVGSSDYFSFGIISQGIQSFLFKIKASDLSGTITANNGGITLGTTPAQGITSIGDSVVYRIRRDNFTFYFDVINVTQSTSQSFTFNYTNVDVVSGTVIPFRAFSITLNPISGTIDIDYVKLYNQERLYADWLMIGHSIAEGFNAGLPDSTYYNRLQSYFPDKRFGLYALSGSKAIDFINGGSLQTDMLALRPKRAIIMLGINEIQAGVPTQTFISNMRALVDTLENHYVQVIVCNTTPYNAAHKDSIIAYNSALLTEFGPQLINIYDTLEINGLMQSSNDSLHPDAAGHRYMFNVMKDYITNLTNTPYDPEAIIRIFPRGIESGRAKMGVQSNFGIIPLNLGGSGTLGPGVGYNVKFLTTSGYNYFGNDYANFIQMGVSGKMVFKVADNGNAGDPITFKDAMAITPAGDVGIGETTPLAALHIKRNQVGKTTLGQASMFTLDNSHGGLNERQEISMGYRNGNAYSPVVLGNVVTDGNDFTNSAFYIATRDTTTNTAPTEKVRVTAKGAVGINTSTPAWGLDVQRSMGAKKDSITHITSISTNELLTIDTATGQFKRILPSNLGSGITTLNTLTASTQTFATGTSGSDFNISSATSTHTFNIPTASASNRGLLSTTDWSTFNGKVGSINSQTGSTQTIAGGTGISVNSGSNTHTISLDTNYVISGTFIPTLYNVSNVGASTAYQCQYMRVGNVVTVSGKVDIDPTAVGTWQLGMSLPIASGFTASEQCGGTGVAGGVSDLYSSVRADATNDRAEFIGTIPVAGSVSNNTWYFTFTYSIPAL